MYRQLRFVTVNFGGHRDAARATFGSEGFAVEPSTLDAGSISANNPRQHQHAPAEPLTYNLQRAVPRFSGLALRALWESS